MRFTRYSELTLMTLSRFRILHKRRHLIIFLIRNLCQDFLKKINRWLFQTLLLLTLCQQLTTGGQAGYAHTKMVT